MIRMSNNIRSSSEVNNFVCKAPECYSKANNKIAMKVGSKTIFCFLCDNCKPKFYSPSHQDTKGSQTEVPSD
jgi:transcription initiation factor IIE alpha subunit